jgi:carbamoyl-phosphate synthase large subunit
MKDSDGAILITSSGRRVELWNLFEQAIAEEGLQWRVIGADAASASATAIAKGPVFQVPRVLSADFHPAVKDLVEREHVKLIVPTIDTELEFLAATDFGVAKAVSSPATVAICRDKLETSRFAASCGIPVAETHLVPDYPDSGDARWVLKPRFGSSSIGVHLGITVAVAESIARGDTQTPYILQRQLRGEEYTVNFFVNRAGRCTTAVPHRRLVTRSGEVSQGIVVREPRLEALTRQLAEALPGAYAACCAQFIDDEDIGFSLIELNARFGGGYPLAHRAGARFPQRLVRDVLRRPELHDEDWENGWAMFRYDQSAFLEPGRRPTQ